MGTANAELVSDYAVRYDLRIRPLLVEDWIEARLPNGRTICGRTVGSTDPPETGRGSRSSITRPAAAGSTTKTSPA